MHEGVYFRTQVLRWQRDVRLAVILFSVTLGFEFLLEIFLPVGERLASPASHLPAILDDVNHLALCPVLESTLA
jgi:hypothetical protein